MIDIYTNKINSKDWILQNDLYFNLNTGNEEMSQKEMDLIWQIDIHSKLDITYELEGRPPWRMEQYLNSYQSSC